MTENVESASMKAHPRLQRSVRHAHGNGRPCRGPRFLYWLGKDKGHDRPCHRVTHAPGDRFTMRVRERAGQKYRTRLPLRHSAHARVDLQCSALTR